jgi:hypothetical protein
MQSPCLVNASALPHAIAVLLAISDGDWLAVGGIEPGEIGGLPIWRMPAKSAVCSKIGTVALRTDSGEERGRGFGSVFHHQQNKKLTLVVGFLFCCAEIARELVPRPVRARGEGHKANSACVLFAARSANTHADVLAGQDGQFPPYPPIF